MSKGESVRGLASPHRGGTKAAFNSTQTLSPFDYTQGSVLSKVEGLSANERDSAPTGKKRTIYGEQRRTILMIEDDSNLAEMYKMKLESSGFNVIVSPDGKYGIRAIRDHHPDLVLLDILMPGRDGFDFLSDKGKCSISEVQNTPVIVLTNLASPDDQAEGKRLGVADWWIKAYNTPAEVAQKARDFLKEK